MKRVIIAALIFNVAGVNVFAHSGATGIVKERMDAMSSISKNAKQISLMLKGKSQYNIDTIAISSREITAHAKAFPKMFPEGSTDHPSEAAPAIWERSDEFSKKAQELIDFANDLTLLAKNNSEPTAIKEAFSKVKNTCKSCHSDFRIK